MAPGSEPAPGSVSPKHPIHSPVASLGRYFSRWAVAEGVNGMHHQAGLHRQQRTESGIHPLELARDQAIGHVARIGAAIFFRERDADQAKLAHLVENLAVGLFFEIGLGDARQQLVLRVGARGVADHALVFGQLLVEQERIVPTGKTPRPACPWLEGARS